MKKGLLWTSVVAAVIAVLVSVAVMSLRGGKNNLGGTTNLDSLSLDSTLSVTGATTLTGALTQTGAATLSSTLSVTGTTTLTQSVDGLVVGGTFLTTATGTVRTIYTNSTGPKFCDAGTSFLYLDSKGFSPSLVFSMGTSTSAIASTNLVSSTTVATTTDTVIVPAASKFILADGDVLTAIIGDITNANASSTNYGNWKAEAGVWCTDLSI